MQILNPSYKVIKTWKRREQQSGKRKDTNTRQNKNTMIRSNEKQILTMTYRNEDRWWIGYERTSPNEIKDNL